MGYCVAAVPRPVGAGLLSVRPGWAGRGPGRRGTLPPMSRAEHQAILYEARGRACEVRDGVLAHRRACPLCRGVRSAPTARALAAVERRFLEWWPVPELADEAECTPAELVDHARQFGLDQVRANDLEAAAIRALELALAGDPAGRVVLSAVDRLRELRADGTPAAPGPPAGRQASAAGSTWEALLGLSPSPEDEEGEPH